MATVVFGRQLTRRPHEGCYFCLRIENRAHKTHIFANGTWGLCWGGVGGVGWGGGVNVLSSAYSTYYYAPEISGMLATLHVGVGWGGGVNVLSSAYSTYCYAPEISGMLATLHVSTLQRSPMVSLPRYILLRCRDLLWYPCHVTLHSTCCRCLALTSQY